MGKISTETDKIFRVSLPGYDVETATPEQCAIHSGFDYPKIEENLEGVISVTTPSSIPYGETFIETIDHNLGYVPCVLIFTDTKFDTQGNYTILPSIFLGTSYLGIVFWRYDFDVTATQVKLKIVYEDIFGLGALGPGTNSPAGITVKFKYQIWVND